MQEGGHVCTGDQWDHHEQGKGHVYYSGKEAMDGDCTAGLVCYARVQRDSLAVPQFSNLWLKYGKWRVRMVCTKA